MLLGQFAGFQQLFDGKAVVMHGEHHFHVQPGLQAAFCLMHAVDEIAHHKAVKAPFLSQDIREQFFACATVMAVIFVVSAHDGLRACVDALFEMRQIHFVQRSVITLNINKEAQILDAVQSIMLGTGNYAFFLHAAGKRFPVFAQQEGIFTIAFLAAAPAGIAHQVDAHTGIVICALSNRLIRYGLAEAIFQIGIKCRCPQHGDRKAGAVAHDHPPWPICKQHGRNAQTLAAAGTQRTYIVVSSGFDHIHLGLPNGMAGQHVDFFLQRHIANNPGDLRFQVFRRWIFLIIAHCFIKTHRQFPSVFSHCILNLMHIFIRCYAFISAVE